MPQERLPMRKIRDILRLSASGLSKRKIAPSLVLSATAAGDCLRRARKVDVAWPLAAELTDAALERLLYRSAAPVEKRRPEPGWATVHRELKRAGVTLQLLWEEYRAAHPDSHGYSRFCQRYQEWKLRNPQSRRNDATLKKSSTFTLLARTVLRGIHRCFLPSIWVRHFAPYTRRNLNIRA
jgi:hypothetical protein